MLYLQLLKGELGWCSKLLNNFKAIVSQNILGVQALHGFAFCVINVKKEVRS